jgi:O-antigen/teichoic acid export membrane protein
VRFARDVLVFGWANVICLLLNAILTFLLPRYLTIEDFGHYRLFVLYSSMAGLVHFGLLDGILVRWAEKPDERIEPEIKSTLIFLLVQHGIVLGPACLLLARWFRTTESLGLWLGLVAYVIVFNCSTIGQVALQARKQFDRLSFFTVVTVGSLLGLLLMWKLAGRLSALTAIASYVVANMLAAIGIWRAVLKPGAGSVPHLQEIGKFGIANIHLGWRILIANSLLTLIPSLDRFFVSGALSIRDFAIYAFAGNALAIVYTVATSAARVVYPYLSEGASVESRRRAYTVGRAALLALWSLSLALYFPTALLVQWILPKYVISLPVVRVLMINSGFVSMIHILHANYFRVSLALNQFLIGSAVGLASAVLLLTLAKRVGSLEWFAGAMTAAVVVWWATNEGLLARSLGDPWSARFRILALWLVSSGLFLTACSIRSVWLGGLSYMATAVPLVAFGIRHTLLPLWAQVLHGPRREEPRSFSYQ